MKKIILFLISIITFIGVVNAEEYMFNFRSKRIYAPESLNAIYKGGYVFIDSTSPSRGGGDVFISYYDSNGKLLKTNTTTNKVLYNIVTDDKYLYAYGEERDTNFNVYYFVYKFDENFNVIKSLAIPNYKSFLDYQAYRSKSVGIGKSILRYENNQLKLLSNIMDGYDDLVSCSIDLNLTDYNCQPLGQTNDFLDWQKFSTHIHNNNVVTYTETEPIKDGYLLSLSKDNIYCFEGNYDNDPLKPSFLAESRCQREAELHYYDKNNNEVWKKDFKKYSVIENLRVNKRNIIAIGKVDGGKQEVIILDHEGNLVQIIPVDNSISRLEINNYSIVFNSILYESCLGAFPYDVQECTNNGTHEVYYLEYEIETKVTKGKGTIEAIKTSKAGESVTFTVTPAEGYTLGEVKVTDRDGKVIVFKQNTFTMPDADVLVEGTFLASNPETKDIAIALTVMLAIIALIITLIESKKLKEIGV